MSLVTAVYTLLPWLIFAYGAVVYATPRNVSRERAWSSALAIAVALTAGAVFVMRAPLGGLVSTATLIEACAMLYFPTALLMTGAALAMRGRVRLRPAGLILLLVLFLGVNWGARRASGLFFDLVQAVG